MSVQRITDAEEALRYLYPSREKRRSLSQADVLEAGYWIGRDRNLADGTTIARAYLLGLRRGYRAGRSGVE